MKWLTAAVSRSARGDGLQSLGETERLLMRADIPRVQFNTVRFGNVAKKLLCEFNVAFRGLSFSVSRSCKNIQY